MAVIKLGAGITDISGKMGGIVFGRDSTGLHIRTHARGVNRASSAEQKPQRDWYSALKFVEHHGGVTPPEDAEEPKEKEAQIFLIGRIDYLHGQSLTVPEMQSTTSDADILIQIHFIVEQHWGDLKWIPNLTKEAAEVVIAKLYWQYRTQLNATHAAALAAATQRLLAAAAYCVEVPAWAVVVGAALIALAGVYAFYYIYSTPIWQNHTFGTGNAIVCIKGSWHWGSVYRRATHQMFDVVLISPLPCCPVLIRTDESNTDFVKCYFEYELAYQEITSGLVFYDIYTWDKIRAEHVGNGYKIADRQYRVKFSPYHRYVRDKDPYWQLDYAHTYLWPLSIYS